MSGGGVAIEHRPARAATATTAILVGLAAFGPLSTDLYLPSLPAIGDEFGAGTAGVQFTLSGYLLAFALAQLVTGPLSDRFGRRPVLAGGIGLYVFATIGCSLATSIEALVLFRMAQAMGACAGVVLARAIVRDLYAREYAARAMAIIGSAVAIAPLAGPLAGGVIQATAGWRWNFVILALFGAALLWAVALRLGETNRHPDPSATEPARLAANYARILRDRAFCGYALTVAFAYGGIFAFISGSSFVLIGTFGVEEGLFGVYFGLVVLGWFAGTQLAARLTLRLGIERMVEMGAYVALAGGVALLASALSGLATPDSIGAAAVVVPMMVYLIGAGLALPNAQAGAIGPFPRMAGTAAAMLGFLQMTIAAGIGIAVGHLHDGTAAPMAGMVTFAAAGIALSRLIVPRPRSHAPRPERSPDPA